MDQPKPIDYQPKPIDTTGVELPASITPLIERLAEHNHDIWAIGRTKDGWTYGPQRDDPQKKHPCLVPYDQLPDSEKQYDRDTAVQALKAIVALGHQITPRSLVAWLRRAQTRIQDQSQIQTWNQELETIFAPLSPTQLTISDVFRGYSIEESNRIVLGVQVQTPSAMGSHIVKLGSTEVMKDYNGWNSCVLKHGATGHLLLAVTGQELPNDRYAVVYQDAYRLFGTDPDTETPKPLEVAADWAINDSKPDVLSVERVLVQIFAELDRCLYQGARDNQPSRPVEFYNRELQQQRNGQSAWHRWANDDAYRRLRRDAIWLITARAKPDEEKLPPYLDPFDYVLWALAENKVPQTLVGRSHGDLHGRNILVGVYRGEVEQPVLFDYGDMAESNLPVWDFVKLESELKTRILPKLFDQAEARAALAQKATQVRPPATRVHRKLTPDEQDVADRADRMEFAFQFEDLLASLTRRIVSRHAAETPLAGDQRRITGHAAIDKALCLFYRLRQEAAVRLGYGVERPGHWHDEFYFGLCVYGLLTAKWNVEPPQLEWALISAGVAAAQLQHAKEINPPGQEAMPVPATLPSTLPSHLVPLAWAHRLWKDQRSSEACQLLDEALRRFPAAVTLNTEYALCLAASGDLEKATAQVLQLKALCPVFRDDETLCRLARIYKDLGDRAWADDPSQPDIATFVANRHPGHQLYRLAFELYREAFVFSRRYFPGINAATMAMLIGETADQERLADEVCKICGETRDADPEERFWLCATEGEAWLLKADSNEALRFYRAALATPCGTKLGMVQTMYKQLCRLYWALRPATVQVIVDELNRREIIQQLKPGPFGDCGRRRPGPVGPG